MLPYCKLIANNLIHKNVYHFVLICSTTYILVHFVQHATFRIFTRIWIALVALWKKNAKTKQLRQKEEAIKNLKQPFTLQNICTYIICYWCCCCCCLYFLCFGAGQDYVELLLFMFEQECLRSRLNNTPREMLTYKSYPVLVQQTPLLVHVHSRTLHAELLLQKIRVSAKRFR